MKKRDLLKALEAIGDYDYVLIKCDGGDYWGDYLETPQVTLDVLHFDLGLGHPGGYNNKVVVPSGSQILILER